MLYNISIEYEEIDNKLELLIPYIVYLKLNQTS